MLGHATKREAMSSKILGKTCDVLKDNTRLIDLNFFSTFFIAVALATFSQLRFLERIRLSFSGLSHSSLNS